MSTYDQPTELEALESEPDEFEPEDLAADYYSACGAGFDPGIDR
jgi:hypothetical protein